MSRVAMLAAAVLVGCSIYSVDRSDPRFAACGGDRNAMAAFRLRASEYANHFPNFGRAPELETDTDAFAVVHGPEYVPAITGSGPAPRPAPGTRYVCIYVGMPPGGERTVYGPVDLTGMRP